MESAVVVVAIPASHKADVQSEPSKKSPIVSQIHISMLPCFSIERDATFSGNKGKSEDK